MSLSDPNRVVVSDTAANAEYLIAYREAGTNNGWTYKANYPVNNSSATQIVSTADELNKGWEVGIFAAVDQKNEGGKTALTKTEFEKMSVTDQQKYLITSSTQKGLGVLGRFPGTGEHLLRRRKPDSVSGKELRSGEGSENRVFLDAVVQQ